MAPLTALERRRPAGSLWLHTLFLAGAFVHLAGPCQHNGAVADPPLEAIRVEVDVGHGGEQRLGHEAIDPPVSGAQGGCPVAPHRDALGGVDQQILQRRGRGVLAAHPGRGAARAPGGLLALVTEHLHRFLLGRCWCYKMVL